MYEGKPSAKQGAIMYDQELPQRGMWISYLSQRRVHLSVYVFLPNACQNYPDFRISVLRVYFRVSARGSGGQCSVRGSAWLRPRILAGVEAFFAPLRPHLIVFVSSRT